MSQVASSVWAQLPPELAAHIFALLQLRSVVRCAQVCRLWSLLVWPAQRSLCLPPVLAGVGADPLGRLLQRLDGARIRAVDLSYCLSAPHVLDTLVHAAPLLERLSLRYLFGQLEDAHVALLGRAGLARLVDLRLDCASALTEAALHALAPLSLTRLSLAGCSRLPPEIGPILAAQGLVRLSLASCSLLSAATLRALAESTTLRSLCLARCFWLSDAALAGLRGLPLTRLHVSHCKELTEAALPAYSPLLRTLKAQGLPRLTTLWSVPALSALTHVDLAHCDGLTSAALVATLPLCVGLRWLSLAHCAGVTGAVVAALAPLPLLCLSLEGCALGEDGLRGLPRTLTALTLRGCLRLGDAALLSLTGLPLRTLDVGGCSSVTALGFSQLSAHTALTELSLAGTGVRTSTLLHVAALTALRTLDLRALPLPDAALTCLAPLSHLRTLRLAGNTVVTDVGLARLPLASLRTLDVAGCEKLSRYQSYDRDD